MILFFTVPSIFLFFQKINDFLRILSRSTFNLINFHKDKRFPSIRTKRKLKIISCILIQQPTKTKRPESSIWPLAGKPVPQLRAFLKQAKKYREGPDLQGASRLFSVLQK